MSNKTDKISKVAQYADYLVENNIWPSGLMVDKLLGKQTREGSFSRQYLRKWKNGIGLKGLDRSKFKSCTPKTDCGDACGDYRVTHLEKILCPVHFTVKDK